MHAEIINIGDEILIGQIVNTNAAWMAEALTTEGISVERVTVIADRAEQITSALERALGEMDLVLITGGLGPTRDDITKHTLCSFFGMKLEMNEEALEMVRAFFASRGIGLNEINRQQALLPSGCAPIPNHHGTAPGMWFDHHGKVVVSMPGVPFEMQGMMEASILPRLRQMNAGNLILHRTVLTHGMGESFLSRRLAHWEDTLPEGVSLAYLPSPGQVRLRLTIRGNDRERMRSMLDVAIRGLQVRIPRLIFGYGQDTMEGVTGQLLRTRQERVATAESCTGGYLAHLLTSVAGSSAYYQGSIIAYDNNVKVRLLGVDPLLLDRGGAVSEDVVRAMAEGARRRLGTDWAMATSGIAGPEGGTEEKPVGTTWISVAGPQNTLARKFLFGQRRDRNIRMAALAALNMLRLELLRPDD